MNEFRAGSEGFSTFDSGSEEDQPGAPYRLQLPEELDDPYAVDDLDSGEKYTVSPGRRKSQDPDSPYSGHLEEEESVLEGDDVVSPWPTASAEANPVEDISEIEEELPSLEAPAKRMSAEALENVRTEVTILFSDIKGSTSYYERKGDLEGLAMVQHHNSLLFPVIERHGGRVVKTIGDAIMACFPDPSEGIVAAMEMQQVLEKDRATTPSADEHIHIRVGLHMGLGLERDNDIYGDVVNVTAKVQQQANPDQILITDALLGAAADAGAQYAKLGPAEIKGKDETIHVYAVAWSRTATDQLIEEVQHQYEGKLKDLRHQYHELDEEFEESREQWRSERRRLNEEIESLEAEVEKTRETAGQKAAGDLQAQIRRQLEEALHVREELEQSLAAERARWDAERDSLREQIESLQIALLDSKEQTNNPARLALAVREQVDVRLKDAKRDWQAEWDAERRRLNAEIDRLRKLGNADDQKNAARRALLEKLGKAPVDPPKSAAQWQEELARERSEWEAEREQLKIQLRTLDREIQHARDEVRQTIFHELRGEYESRIQAYERESKLLRADMESAKAELEDERARTASRIERLENLIPEAEEAARTQTVAELQMEFEAKVEELKRLKTRTERRAQDDADEADVALRRAKKEITRLQEELKEAREIALRAQRGARSTVSTS